MTKFAIRRADFMMVLAYASDLATGHSKLDISPKTADHHIQSIYGKIGVTTRAAAALYSVEQGLLKAGEAPA
jgi:hypothetical protein